VSAVRQYYIVEKTGSLRNLTHRTSAIPKLTEGHVLVEVKAVGLNYADLFAIMGLYSATPKGPFIPGLEFAGVVSKSNSSKFKEGDRVYAVTRFGGYDSHIVADPEYLMMLPSNWSFEEGAAFPVQTLTAYYALKPLGNLQNGQTILIHSAAGGVGIQAHRIAKKFNAYTIGVVGHASKLQVLEEEGFDKGIVRGPNFRAELKNALGGRDLNLVLEATGGKYFKYSYQALAPMGRVVAYGSAQFTPSSDRPNYLTLVWKYLFRPRIDPLSMIPANKSVLGFNLIWLYERNTLMKELLDEIDLLNLPPPKVGHTFPFSGMHEAITLFKSGKTIGKVVLRIG
jgi:NADPH:quinone reductase-like Zn-dependent oxidoreductase